MGLVDWEIKETFAGSGMGAISPWNSRHVQPNSYEVTLDATVKRYKYHLEPLNPADLPEREDEFLSTHQLPYILLPGEFILGSTVEDVYIPPTVCGEVHGKSTLARLGLSVHQTGGLLDSGFIGQITLEIRNSNDMRGIVLTAGMLIAQLTFERNQAPHHPYGTGLLGSKYQGQAGPTAPRSQPL